MQNFFEELKKYFEITPQEKIKDDWEKSIEFDKIRPTVDEFIHTTQQLYQIQSEEPLGISMISNTEFDPKFTSGFFMTNKNISQCKKQHFQ